MKITKEYKFEAAHIVRNCASRRCSHTIHGHSYRVILTLAGAAIDKGAMIIDFGLLKNTIGKFIDVFDHSLMIWDEDTEMVDVALKTSERIVFMPFNCSAESIALVILAITEKLIGSMIFNNGETGVRVHQVQVFETATGSAIAEYGDVTDGIMEHVKGTFYLSEELREAIQDIITFENGDLSFKKINLPKQV